jgi:hypothetical protein
MMKVIAAPPGDADAAARREAALEVRSNPAYLADALRRSRALAGANGAANAARAVESLLGKASCGRLAAE